MKVKYLIVIILVTGVLSFYIGRKSVKPVKKIINVSVATLPRSFNRVIEPIDDVFPMITEHGDTITAETPIGEFPPREIPIDDSIPFYVNDSLLWAKFKMRAIIFGVFQDYTLDVPIWYVDIPVEVDQPPLPSQWRVNVYAAFYHDLTFDAIGIIMYKRIGVIGNWGTTRIWTDVPEINTHYKVGVVGRIL